MSIYADLVEREMNGMATVLITVVGKTGHGPAKIGFKMLVGKEGRVKGTVGGGNFEYIVIEDAKFVLKERINKVERYYLGESEEIIEKSGFEIIKQTDMACGGTISLYFEYNGVRDTVYLFGGGHVGEAILYHIRRLNYEVILVDERKEILEKFNGDFKTCSDFNLIEKKYGLKPKSYYIIATYSHELDYEILKMIIGKKCSPKYIGVIASKKKSKTILDKIREETDNRMDLEKIKSPIGLNIGGNTADEIAISVISELQTIKYGKEDFIWK